MINYQLGKIYRIIDNVTGLVYIGSTCDITLARRLSGHRGAFKLFKNGKGNFMTSFIILKNDNFEIFLIEKFPCNCKDELHARERHFIENNKCVNKVIPNRTLSEYYNDNKEEIKEYKKEYYITNKEVITEQKKKYYNDNKEARKEQQKHYRTENKEAIKQYRTDNKEALKQYRTDNKEALKEKRKIYYQKIKALKQAETA